MKGKEITAEQVALFRERYEAGDLVKVAAAAAGIGVSTARNLLRRLAISQRDDRGQRMRGSARIDT